MLRLCGALQNAPLRGVMTHQRLVHLAVCGFLFSLVTASPALASGSISRASVSSTGAQADDISYAPDVSADGRYVVFDSDATNLVPDDNNWATDVFLRDRQLGTTQRLSMGLNGAEANGESIMPVISADGRFVAFASAASNLVSSDTNGWVDVFVVEVATGQTTRVSVSSAGVEGNGRSFEPAISADGRYIAFTSTASNLVGSDPNLVPDVFLYDRSLGSITRISTGLGGAAANDTSGQPALSASGRVVAFRSKAGNLVAGDTNELNDIFVRDLTASTTTRVSVGPAAVQANGASIAPDLSSDGGIVVFESAASNLVTGDTNGVSDIFAYNRTARTTTRVSVGPGGVQANLTSTAPAISGDGDEVAFATYSAFDAADTNTFMDLYVRDLVAGTTTLITASADGGPTDDNSYETSLSADRRAIAFLSDATGLVGSDNNRVSDVFVYEGAAEPHQTTTISARTSGAIGTLKYATNDILLHSRPAGAWAMALDASALTPALTQNLTAFTFLPGGGLAMAFLTSQPISGVGTFTPYDVALFTPATPGDYSRGTFRTYLKGSTVGLSTTAEKIDALAWSPDGYLVVSTTAVASVPCAITPVTCPAGVLKVQDEDLIALHPSGSSGTWELVFDGSTVPGLAVEDVVGASYDEGGTLYLSVYDSFAAGGAKGNAKSILRATPAGASYTLSTDWYGPDYGFLGLIDAFEVNRPAGR